MSNLPPGVSEWMIPGYNDFEIVEDQTCPNCGHEFEADVLCSFEGPRITAGTTIHKSYECPKCGHEWEREEEVEHPDA